MANLLRPLVPGDVVVTYCAWLAGWTGAQVLRDSYRGKTVEIVDLDWVSPTEPHTVDELGEIRPLVNPLGRRELPRFAQINVPRLLPKSYRVLGNTPPLQLPPGYVLGDWKVGFLLDEAQRQAAGEPPCPWLVDCDQSDLGKELEGRSDGEVLALALHRINELDCADLVRTLPHLVSLFLSDTPDHPFRPYTGPDSGTLTNAAALNDLQDLETLHLHRLYGMTAADAPRPESLTKLGRLSANGIPHDFALETRRLWRPVAKFGTALSVRKAGTEESHGEARTNS